MKIAAIIFLIFISDLAFAHDPNNRFAKSDLNDWFSKLKSPKGRCCSNNDGALVQDADWDTVKGPDGLSHYRVRIEKQWVVVPDDAVVTEPNQYGPAMVWGYPIRMYGSVTDSYNITCFMPGVMG
jgi:hypothetical protein